MQGQMEKEGDGRRTSFCYLSLLWWFCVEWRRSSMVFVNEGGPVACSSKIRILLDDGYKIL
jgi:hypothetical protein